MDLVLNMSVFWFEEVLRVVLCLFFTPSYLRAADMASGLGRKRKTRRKPSRKQYRLAKW